MVSQRERLIGRIRAPIDRPESIAHVAGIPRSGLGPIGVLRRTAICGIRKRNSTGTNQDGLSSSAAEWQILGRPPTASQKANQVRNLYFQNISKSEIARRLHIGRTSVRRILG